MQAEAQVLTDHYSHSEDYDRQVGTHFKHGAKQLHDALARLEEAVSHSLQRVGGAVVDDLADENQNIKQALEAKTAENKRLAAEVEALGAQNRQISTQVHAVSGRLEELIGRIGKLLAE